MKVIPPYPLRETRGKHSSTVKYDFWQTQKEVKKDI